MRIDKINYYLDIAQTVAERATFMRRRFGSVIVKNDAIISTGYNGAPRGRANCTDLGYCLREKFSIPTGTRYELCRSVHAEANAIINADREKMIGSTLYLACLGNDGSAVPGTDSCMMCKRMVINAGISEVYVRDTATEFRRIDVNDWILNDDSLSVRESGY